MGLICPDGEKEELAELMCKTGFVRVAKPEEMSRLYAGMPHDGEYGLRRYTKTVTL